MTGTSLHPVRENGVMAAWIELNTSRLLGSGRFPPRYSAYDVPLETPIGSEEKSTTLYAPWFGDFVSTAVCNLEPSSDAFHSSASICAAVKASYLLTLTAKADITCEWSF